MHVGNPRCRRDCCLDFPCISQMGTHSLVSSLSLSPPLFLPFCLGSKNYTWKCTSVLICRYLEAFLRLRGHAKRFATENLTVADMFEQACDLRPHKRSILSHLPCVGCAPPSFFRRTFSEPFFSNAPNM